MSTTPFQYNPNFFNTEEIAEVMIYKVCEGTSESAANNMPTHLLRYGLQLSPDEYRDIIYAFTSIFYVRCHGCFNKALIVTELLIAIVIFIPYFIMSLGSQMSRDRVGIIVVIALLTSSSMVILLAVVQYIVRLCWGAHSLTRAIEKANRIASTRNLMICVVDHGCCYCACNKMSIIFKYYDWRPCLSVLKQFIIDQLRNSGANDEEASANSEETSLLINATENNASLSMANIENEAEKLLIQHATEYGQLLMNGRNATPEGQRHNRQGECLCQFVESILVSGKTSCIDCIFQSRSRNPWIRLG